MHRKEVAPNDGGAVLDATAVGCLQTLERRQVLPIQWNMPGFGPLTRIETQFGDFPAQTLRVRDRVRTRNGLFAEIRWLDRIILSEDFLRRHPEALPILIPAGSVQRGVPMRDLVISPGQTICLESKYMEHGERAARDLAREGRAFRKPEPMFTYTLFHCGVPVEVRAEGIWVRLNPE